MITLRMRAVGGGSLTRRARETDSKGTVRRSRAAREGESDGASSHQATTVTHPQDLCTVGFRPNIGLGDRLSTIYCQIRAVGSDIDMGLHVRLDCPN
jgi:hypothetical protein